MGNSTRPTLKLEFCRNQREGSLKSRLSHDGRKAPRQACIFENEKDEPPQSGGNKSPVFISEV